MDPSTMLGYADGAKRFLHAYDAKVDVRRSSIIVDDKGIDCIDRDALTRLADRVEVREDFY